LTSNEQKIKVQFIYPNKEIKEYEVTADQAKELEILSITNPPKRLMKTIRRVIHNLLDKEDNDEVNLDIILGPSRSGDIYNALKYLEYEGHIERRKDFKIIKIRAKDKLSAFLKEIEDLLRK
jgi:hypothetical protein